LADSWIKVIRARFKDIKEVLHMANLKKSRITETNIRDYLEKKENNVNNIISFVSELTKGYDTAACVSKALGISVTENDWKEVVTSYFN